MGKSPLKCIVALLVLALQSGGVWAAAPVAQNDTVIVTDRYRAGDNEFRVIVDVIANDRDPDGQPLIIDPDSITLPRTLGDKTRRGDILQLDDETLVYTASDYAEGEPFEAVSFNYRLFGSGTAAEVVLRTEGSVSEPSEPAEDPAARNDGAITQPGVQVTIPVLDNDVGFDVVRSTTNPDKGTAQIVSSGTEIRYTPDPEFISGQDQFAYVAGVQGQSQPEDEANVTITIEDDSAGGLSTVIFDDFDSMLDGEALEGREPTVSGPGVTWTGRRIAHLAKGTLQIDGVFESVITNPDQLDGRVRPFLPFEPQNFSGEDYEIEADVKVGGHGWVALNFSHEDNKGIGDCSTTDDPDEDQDLWGFLQPPGEFVSGEFVLRTGCVARGVVLAQVEADDPENPFDVSTTGLNNIVIRVEESCPNGKGHACVSARINGTWVIDRVAYENAQQATSPTSSITNAGLIINLGSEPAAANTVAFDNVSVKVGDVREPRMKVNYTSNATSGEKTLESGELILLEPTWETVDETVNVIVRNQGNGELEIDNAALSDQSPGNPWSMVHAPSTIAPDGVGVIRLQLSANDSGTFQNTLTFDTNDERQPDFVVHVEGTVQALGPEPVARDDFYILPVQLENRVSITYEGACSASEPGLTCNDSGDDIKFDFGALGSPSHGNLEPHISGVIYEPDAGYRGNDSFTYGIVDAVDRTDTATAIITMDGPPAASFSVVCDEASCLFDASSSSDLEDGSSLASYSWDFGDGAVGSGADPLHVYSASGTYPVTLTVSDSQGQTGSVESEVVVDLPPTAEFSFSCIDRDCDFDGTASSDDNGIEAHRWSFGDGRSALGATVQHSYLQSGTFEVSLEVVDTAGQTTTLSKSVLVDVRPTASFSVECESLTCEFDGGGSSDDFGIVQYAWDFGDGTGGAFGQSVTHQFPEEGTYTVTLSVADTIGQTGSTDRAVTVFDEESFLLLLILEFRR